jgi:hypothetical protein
VVIDERIVRVLQACEQRLANLAQEMAAAGAQALQAQFGFTEEQATAWLDAMLAQAKANRAASAQKVLRKAGDS